MATKRKIPVKKNPAAAGIAKEEILRTWVVKPEGERVQTVTVHTPDGQYVSAILHNSDIVYVGNSKEESEKGVLSLYRKAPPNPPATTLVPLGPISVEIEWDERTKSYSSYSPELELASSGYTQQEALEHMKEAIRGHLEVSREFRMHIRISEAKQKELERAT